MSNYFFPLVAVGENLGCFGANKKKKEAAQATDKRREGVPLTKNPISQSDPVGGMALLWQPEVVQCYLSLLSECSNPETLEAAAGAIQNLAACYWQVCSFLIVFSLSKFEPVIVPCINVGALLKVYFDL